MKWYLWIIILATILSLSGLAIISIKQDPFQATNFIKFLFFCSLFVSVWGIGTLVLMGLKNDFTGAFRRGLWLAVLALGGITLNRLHLLNIFNFSILLGVIAGIEWFLAKTFSRKDKESWT
ncbi:MAG: hypothetical protein HYT66_00210 [Candidatus Yanofskybacteria bacterium]|nr:hypothetical protein [Candidatus Yanofskybacteria bacterium]